MGFLHRTQTKCSFCNVNPDTLLHIFYEYKIIRDMWNDVIDWISSKLISLNF